MVIDGQEVSFNKTQNLFIEPGEFVIDGSPVGLTYAAAGPKTIAVASGSLRIDGSAVGLDVGPAWVRVYNTVGQVEYIGDSGDASVTVFQAGGQVEAEDAETPWVKSYQAGSQVEMVDPYVPETTRWVRSYQVGAQVEWKFPHPAVNSLVFSTIDPGMLLFSAEDDSHLVFSVL